MPTRRAAVAGDRRVLAMPGGTLMATITAMSEWMEATAAATSSEASARTTSCAASSELATAGRRWPRRVSTPRRTSLGKGRTHPVCWGRDRRQ